MSAERIKVLLVDDDQRLLSALQRALRRDFDITTAEGAVEGLRALERAGPFPVVVSDQNMPRILGSTFLSKSSDVFPDTVRIMLTGNNDQETAIKAVNEAKVFRFLNKPCNSNDLSVAIRDAYRQYELSVGEKRVLEETLTGSVRLLVEMLSMAHPEIFRRSQLVRKWAKAAVAGLGMQYSWSLKVAAMLWPIPDTMLPADLAMRRNNGETLSEKEMKTVFETKLAASRMITAVPRLEDVARLILLSSKQTQDALGEHNAPQEAKLLHILIDLSRAIDPSKPNKLEDGFKRLQAEDHGYDPALLMALPNILSGETGDGKNRVMTILARELRPGDLLMDDLNDAAGRLLLAAGHEITESLASTLLRMHENGSGLEKVRAVRPA